MPHYYRSIAEIKQSFFEDMGCASCGGDAGMSAGDGGFSGDSAAEGPTAGYDPIMGKRDKFLKKRKRKTT